MEFLAGLYTLLLVAICLLQALLLHRTGKPAARQDDESLKEWLRQQLEAQARVLEEKQDIYEVKCPNCDEEICIDGSVLDKGEIQCPNCGETLTFEFDDECDCCCEDDCDCGCDK